MKAQFQYKENLMIGFRDNGRKPLKAEEAEEAEIAQNRVKKSMEDDDIQISLR